MTILTRRQLPAYSPVSLRKVLLAWIRSIRTREALRESLGSLLRSRFACNTAVLTGSGTQALQLALRLCQEVERNAGAVALPAYSCYDLISASLGSDSKVLFYDVDPESLSPDLDSLKAAILRGARTVVVGNLFGFPLPWTRIRELCRDAEAMVVEDFAQGLGSSWEGSPGGIFGDLTVISFGRGKGWAGGGGGALLVRTGDPDSSIGRFGLAPTPFGADFAAVLMSAFQWLLGRPSLFWIPSLVPGLGLGETRFKEPRIPTDIPTFSATLACLASEEASVEVMIRRKNAERLRALLSDASTSGELRVPRPLAGGEAGFLRFPVLELRRGRPLRESDGARALGIFPGYPSPLADLPQGRALHLVSGVPAFPGARSLAERLVTLPTHRLLVERDFRGVARLLEAR